MADDTSEFFDLTRRAFVELLDRIGIPIVFDGVTKRCVAGPIELKTSMDLVGRVDEASIRVDMLAEDLILIEIVPNTTTCTVDDKVLRITLIDKDPQDPCVRFYAIGDH